MIFSMIDSIYSEFLKNNSLCTAALSIEEARREDPGTNIEYFDEWHGEKGAPLVSGHPSLPNASFRQLIDLNWPLRFASFRQIDTAWPFP